MPEGRYNIQKPTIVEDYLFHSVDLKSVGQFTGLKDKKRKEVYEGDIFEGRGDVATRRYLMVWQNKQASFWAKLLTDDGGEWRAGTLFDPALGTYNVVIGNAYEDPEKL